MRSANSGNQTFENRLHGLSTGQCATLACLLEAAAPKPGNVHRGCDFADMTFLDFAVSAAAIGPVMEEAARRGVGATVLQALRATRRLVDVNTNLGTLLLLAPLACVPRDQPLAAGLAGVLGRLTADDARQVYEAIRLAQPGGLGQVDQMDVADAAPADLLAAMQAAADRDLVARQYGNGFDQVLNFVRPALVEGTRAGWRLTDAIIHTQMQMMVRFPDSLIARKCGIEVAQRAADLAARALAAGKPGDEDYLQALADLDFWLRCDGNRRNPGTTADLIAAGLFVVLRDAQIQPPFA
jgi:triphosphoribosyl-dephospho-CoA synthase